MDMLTALQRSGGIEALARQAGVAPPEALEAAKRLLPTILSALRGFPGGRTAMLEMLERHGGIGLAADVMDAAPADEDRGRQLLDELPDKGGAGEDSLGPLLGMLVGGYVAARAAGHGAGPASIEDLLAGT